jgi:signal transduction histidine kinase
MKVCHTPKPGPTMPGARIGMMASGVITLLAVVLAIRQTLALRAQQRKTRADHDRLETQAQQRTAELTELAHHLQCAREDERSRLARDLHDELGSLLTSAKLDAARIRSRLADTAPEALERLAHLVSTLDEVIALKRRITEDLHPSSLTHLGLLATLEILAREFAERSGVEVHCALAEARLTPSAELTVYRVVQEAVNNTSKHAKATQLWLAMSTHDDLVQVSVRDNGVGFDHRGQMHTAHGLVGMRFRVEAEQGRLRLVSAPGQGTRVEVTLPQAPPSAH